MVVRAVMRAMRLGKYKYYAGSDLQGNQFFDLPNPRSDDWRHAKRTVEYARKLPLSEYGPDSLEPQWLSWLRRTRKEAPTIDEVRAEHARRARLDENVRKLEQAYREEKLRLAQASDIPQLVGGGGGRQARASEQDEGLPSMKMDQEDAQKATQIGLNQDRPADQNPQRTIEERKIEAEQEKRQLRRQFARENPDRPAGTAGQKEAESWSPNAARRR